MSTRNAWTWTAVQEDKLKEEIFSPRVLALYDTSTRTNIVLTPRHNGLGTVLLQQYQDKWHSVAFTLCALNETKLHYAQIEEAMALTWALERFSEYVLGKVVQLETDHKPLIPLFRSEALDLLTLQVLRLNSVLCDFNTIHRMLCIHRCTILSTL